MKLLLTILLTLLAAVGLTHLALRDTGYALLSYGEWSVESSLSLLLAVVAATFVALYFLLRLLSRTVKMPRELGRWNSHRRFLRARKATRRGLIALAEGRWERAEKELIRHVEDFDAPLLNYLGAARAAQKLGSDARRDDYLAQAIKSMPDAKLAVGLTQAEVQLSHGQYEQALASLIHLRQIAPNHTHVLYLLKRLYEKLESWEDLLDLISPLRRNKVMDQEALTKLEKKAHRALLDKAARSGLGSRLREQWESVPKSLRTDPVLVRHYVDYALALGLDADLDLLLRNVLRKQWDDELVRQFGLVKGGDPGKQLQSAEEWLKNRERHPMLLLTLGRLCLYNQLWGKARSYLEASLGAEPRAETYCELGNLLNQLGEGEEATRCYRKGLTLAVGGTCTEFTIEGQGPRHLASELP